MGVGVIPRSRGDEDPSGNWQRSDDHTGAESSGQSPGSLRSHRPKYGRPK